MLRLIETDRNHFPLRGMLIKGESAKQWLKEIQLLNVSLEEVTIYPVPGTTANSIWGCLLIFANKLPTTVGKHQLCQHLEPKIFIGERATIYPMPASYELEKIFGTSTYVVHPDFGWVELNETLQLEQLITLPPEQKQPAVKPESGETIPKTIRSFQIQPLPPAEILRNLEEQVFPKTKAFNDKPLNLFEKLRLNLYKALSGNSDDAKSSGNKTFSGEVKEGNSFFSKLLHFFDGSKAIQKDFENLEERNKKNVEKLMELLKKDPEQGLQYAIPLDEGGTVRGGPKQSLDLTKRWFDFSLGFLNKNSPGSGSVDLGDHFYELQKQYHATADALMKKGEYKKASFVYMKLLKNYLLAAEALAAGKFYQEAALIYLNHVNNKTKAAECYEKGNMTKEAIGLYDELKQFEKVGDLYMTLSQRDAAIMYYTKVIEDYKSRGQYVKAALLYREKVGNPMAAQSMLLDGWRKNHDAVNCLNMYFSHIEDPEHRHNELWSIYQLDVTEERSAMFLDVVKHEFKKTKEFKESIKEIAYEIVSRRIAKDPSIVSELKEFNPDNKELFKDTLRFKFGMKNPQ